MSGRWPITLNIGNAKQKKYQILNICRNYPPKGKSTP